MEVKINRRQLVDGLTLVQGVVEKRTTMPILTHVLIEAEGKEIILKATDMELGLLWRNNAEVKKPGKAVVPAKGFFDIVRELPSDMVELSLSSEGWMEIKSGKSKFKIVGLKPEEFPPLPKREDGKSFSLSADTLNNMIDATSFAMSSDEARYQLNGTHWEAIDEKLSFAATDGHRLSIINGSATGNLSFKPVIVPRKGMLELKRLSDKTSEDIQIWVGDKYTAVNVGGTILIIRLVEGKFPPYNQVVPKNQKRVAIINRGEFIAALKRMITLSADRSLGVKLILSPKTLELTAINPDFGEGYEEIAVDYKGDKFEIGFNARYLTEAVSSFEGETVEFQLGDEVAPGMICDKNFTHVIMPMRI